MASYSLGYRGLLSHAEDLGHGGESRVAASQDILWVGQALLIHAHAHAHAHANAALHSQEARLYLARREVRPKGIGQQGK
jgi:hypothetical protein